MSQDTHYHITGVWADDSESGYIFKLDLWGVVEEALDRASQQADFDLDGAHAYAEMGDFEEAWKLNKQSDRLGVVAISLERIERVHRILESGEPSDNERAISDAEWLRSHLPHDGKIATIADFLERLGKSSEVVAPIYRGEDAMEKLTQSALFSLGLISGPTGYQVDLDPIEVWECVDPCEFPTFEEWEEAESNNEMIY